MASATSLKAIKAAEERAKRDSIGNRMVIENLMSTVHGRRWVWLRLSEAQIFVGDTSLDPMYVIYRQGIRNQGLQLLADVTNLTPTQYITMTRENSGVQLEEDEDGGSQSDDPQPE